MAPLAKILEQLVPILGMLEGGAAPLEGGITNRNYVARFDGVSVVLRLPGKDTALLGIDREAEREANEAASRAGVGPIVVALLEDPPCLVTHFIEGQAMAPAELREPEALAAVAGLLRALHGSGERVKSTFSGLAIGEAYAARMRGLGAEVPAAYGPAREAAARIEAAVARLDGTPVLCHDDLLAANFLRADAGGIKIVDWEYAGMGSRYFDLGNFAVNNELGPDQEHAFLAAYFGAPPSPPQLAALGLMRFMSDFREAMWGVLQGTLSDIEFDFAGYAEKHFARLTAAQADPRFETWMEDLNGTES